METKTALLVPDKVLSRLLSLEHSLSTDTAKGRINNHDMIALCLYYHGPMGQRELRELSFAWGKRPRALEPYFNPFYGHVATDFSGKRTAGGQTSHRLKKPFLWHRLLPRRDRFEDQPMVPAIFYLTRQGNARVRELRAQFNLPPNGGVDGAL